MAHPSRLPSGRARTPLAGLVAVAVLLTACGGDDTASLSALELRTICRDGAALHSAAAASDPAGIDRALDDLDEAEVESRTDLDLGALMADADDGDLDAIVDAFTDLGCDPDDVATISTVPETTIPATTVPDTTVPETIVPDTTIPATTVPETTIPATTVPDTTVPDTTVPDTDSGSADAAGIITVDVDSAPLPPGTAINDLLDGSAIDILVAYGVNGMIAPAGPEARVFDMSLVVGRSISEAGRQRRFDTISYLVDSPGEPADILARFRSTVESLGDFSFRDSTSQSDGVTTISFDADVVGFDPTVASWTIGVSTLDDLSLQLITVRRSLGATDIALSDLPGPVDERLGTQAALTEGIGWTLSGYDASVGVNRFNGLPFTRFSLTAQTEETDPDAAADALLAALGDGAELTDSVSDDSRTIVDADGSRWLLIQTLDDSIQATFTPAQR